MREDRDTHLRTRSRVVGDVITVHDQILGESRVVLIVFVVSSDAHATGRDDVEPSSRCADRARGDAGESVVDAPSSLTAWISMRNVIILQYACVKRAVVSTRGMLGC